MLVSERKPLEEILGLLAASRRIFLLGCNGCAAASGTGGEREVLELKGELERAGKEVIGWKVLDFLCQKGLIRVGLLPYEAELNAADAVLASTCGIGVQAAAAVLAEEEARLPVYPACNTISLGGVRGEWPGAERCLECGQCFLGLTAGICPLTACTKQLVNGPCGGAKEGRCEFEPDARPCGWELIYQRLKRQGRLDLLRKSPPIFKDYAKMQPPKRLRQSTKWALELEPEEEVAQR
ncbi:MAG: methylenetetrahydrofolate reductase C-terminal domain-containing protein [Candidatus Bipolaricaulia bacterium]